MKRSVLKNRIKSFFGKHKTTIFVVALSLQLAIGLTIYFLFGRISPNDKIFVPKEGSVAYLVNQNPKFSVDFGKIQEPDKQWVRFEAQTSAKNPFEEEEGNIFTQIVKLFQKKERYGIEMSLVGVDLKGGDLEKYGEEVIQVADVIGTESVKTTTELIDLGREIGVYEDSEAPVSKQTVLNKDVADGVDLEYQILKGLGLKEEIIIRDLEAYKESCKAKECSLPLNEFVFDLKVDSDVQLKEGWFTIDGQSTSTYYFVDSKGRYIAHFLPSFAIDNINNKTFDVNLNVEKGEGNNYKAKVTVNLGWLLSSERVFPVRIDPSIVHDDTADFSGGIFNRTESVTGPKIQIDLEGYNTGLDCSGGIEIINNRYKIHVFKTSGTLTCNSYGNAEVLVVGGGGGGGANYGNGGNSGGGAGGVVHEESFSISGNIAVTVGAGGAAGSSGSDSVFSSLTAEGGGYGAYSSIGGDGGSGGGGNPGGSGSQGGDGGQSYNSGNYSGGGGGGGAGGNGEDAGTAASTANGGDGGVGSSEYSDLLSDAGVGEEVSGIYYIAGGGGGGDYGDPADNTSGLGGLGGGGRRGVAGIANTGGGGGGACEYPNSTNYPGKAGGSGVVIVKYFVGPRSSGEYISGSLDMGSSISEATLSWTPSGVNTGNGETPYSTTGLVAQWNFNETSGTTAVSGGTCGASCNGTLTNMTTTGQDAAAMTGWTANNRRWGAGAVMFDGTNDYMTTASLGFDYDTITISAWINPKILTSRHTIIDLGTETTLVPQLEVGTCNGGTNAVCAMTPGVWQAQTGNNVISTDTWNHIVYTKNGAGATHKIYVNGVEQTLTLNASATYASTAASKKVGSRAGTMQYFNGTLDSLSLYSRVLSADEILSNYQAGNIEFQYRVSADNSTWSNWTSYNDGALMFDGTNDYVTVPDNNNLDLASAITIEAWVNFNNVSITNQTIVGKRDASAVEANYGLQTQIGQFSFYYSANGTYQTYRTSNASLLPNTWYHVVVTFDGSTVKFYKNGTLLSGSCTSGTCNVPMVVDNNSIGIGRPGDYAEQYFNGIIDSVKIYSRVLESTEISMNYAVADGESPSNETSLVGYWKLNEGNGTSTVNIGTCGMLCNGTLTGFSDTTGKDVTNNSGWTAKTKRGSDYPEHNFDNPYLYNPTDTGLIGYWPVDEKSGTSVEDVTGTNNGIATNTTVSSGKYSNNRTFNGTNSYITMANTKSTNMSVAMWIYPTSITNQTNIALVAIRGTTTDGLFLFLPSGGNLNFDFGNGSSNFRWDTGYQPPLNTWTYIVITRDSSGRYLYVNGKLKNSTTIVGGPLTTTANLRFGADSLSTEYYYQGRMDEMQIYDIALPAATIASNYTKGIMNKNSVVSQKLGSIKEEGIGSTQLTSGSFSVDSNTVGLWHLEESGGLNAYIKDSSPNPHNGTSYNTTYVSGKSGGARSFNGSSSYISIESFGFDYNYITIDVWVKPTNLSVRNTAVDMGSNTTLVPQLEMGTCNGGSNAVCVITNGVWQAQTVNNVISANTWNHIVYTKNGTGATHKIYVNGIEQPLATNASATYDSISVGKNIGRRGTSQYFNGTIDEIVVSNIARTANEIIESYKLGKDSYINQTVNTIDLSSKNTMSINIASDRPGTYLSAIWGESAHANYQPDINTVGFWDFNGANIETAYLDKSGNQNNGNTTYYGIECGIRSTNATYIINQYGGASNTGEMDITCTGGDAECVIVTKDGRTLSTPSINSGVAMVDSTTGTNWLMYSPSLTAQGITPVGGASNNYIAVYYTGSAWQYDNNSTYVTFTPQPYNILVGKIERFTSAYTLDIYPIISEGKLGNGMNFNGSSNYITIPNSPTPASTLTIESWIKINTANAGTIYNWGVTSGCNPSSQTLAVSSNKLTFRTGCGTTLNSTNTLAIGIWSHVAVTIDSSGNAILYINGIQENLATSTRNGQSVSTGNDQIGVVWAGGSRSTYFNGSIDEVSVSNIVRTPDEIRQAYEIGLRTHTINVDFGASLVSGNLITGSGDTSFSIDATVYGLANLGSGIYKDEKIIVKENYDGTEYIAQGTVSTITESTGAVTVSSWDSGSTFPSAGYTVNADVFKWQKEYIPIKNRTVGTHVDAVNLLTFRITNGDQGRNIWIDDLRSSSGYLSAYTGEELTFPSSGRYFQYKAIFSTWDNTVTPYISQVQLDYFFGPTLDLLMRHGKWFNSSGVKQPFWWAGAH